MNTSLRFTFPFSEDCMCPKKTPYNCFTYFIPQEVAASERRKNNIQTVSKTHLFYFSTWPRLKQIPHEQLNYPFTTH